MKVINSNTLKTIKINNPKVHKLRPIYNIVIKNYISLGKNGDNPKYSINQTKVLYIDTSKHDKVKSITLFILQELDNKYPYLIDLIFTIFKFSSKEKEETKQFINKIRTNPLKECTCWINLHGTKLMRGLYFLITNNKLPTELSNKVLIKTPEIYGEFSSLDIQKYIETYINLTYFYNVTIDNIELNLSINTNKCSNVNKQIDNIIKRSLILAKIHKANSKINIELWTSKMKKKFPTDYQTLGPKEINSGASSMAGISIWREEEYKKLIIHETIHNLNLDFRIAPTKLAMIFELFNISPHTSIKFFEAYTEIWACVVNCILCSYEINDSSNYTKCLKLLEDETKFTCYQIAKILVFYGFDDIWDFYKPYDGTNRFQQTTSVFSYFFIKGVLLYHLDNFLEFVDTNCNIMHCADDKDVVDKLFAQFISLSQNPMFQNDINTIMKKQKKHILYNDSLRMTFHE